MTLFGSLATVSFYGVLSFLVAAAILTVTTKNLFHSAIFLAFTLLGISVVYFFLHAEFIAGVQILLYVGAIMTLVIFAIMLTARIADPSVPQSNRHWLPVFILMILLGGFLIKVVVKAPWKIAAEAKMTNAVELGRALMGEYVFPFELVSIVLLIALVGAIVLARGNK